MFLFLIFLLNKVNNNVIHLPSSELRINDFLSTVVTEIVRRSDISIVIVTCSIDISIEQVFIVKEISVHWTATRTFTNNYNNLEFKSHSAAISACIPVQVFPSLISAKPALHLQE